MIKLSMTAIFLIKENNFRNTKDIIVINPSSLQN